MSQTKIMAQVIDQTIQLTNTPKLASGNVDTVQIIFDFCPLWDGMTKTAVFYRTEAQVFHVLLEGNAATVPPEVMDEAGTFFFGVFGTGNDGQTRPTEALPLSVCQGALTTATAVPDPTPDIYTQIIQMVQNASIIPDASLTQAGKAADAGAVGTALTQLRQDTNTTVNTAITGLKNGYIKLVRGVHYGTEAEIPADLPEGGLFFKVVE